MEAYTWYRQLIKPSWAPPSWLFGPVWSGLYVMIAISFGKVMVELWRRHLPFWVALPFILNMTFNLAFTPIQFGLKNNYLAAVDIVLVLITLIWAMVGIFPYYKWITYVQIPYLTWVGFATILQITITWMNRKI